MLEIEEEEWMENINHYKIVYYSDDFS